MCPWMQRHGKNSRKGDLGGTMIQSPAMWDALGILHGNFQWQTVKHALVHSIYITVPHFHTTLFLYDASQSSMGNLSPQGPSELALLAAGKPFFLKVNYCGRCCGLDSKAHVFRCLVTSWHSCLGKMVYSLWDGRQEA